MVLRLRGIALRRQTAAEPVAPRRIVLQTLRHMADKAGDFVPTLQAQRGAHRPFGLLLAKLRRLRGFLVVGQRRRHILVFRLHGAEYAPGKRLLFGIQAA